MQNTGLSKEGNSVPFEQLQTDSSNYTESHHLSSFSRTRESIPPRLPYEAFTGTLTAK
ncbi:TPA: hypothetical protein RQK47_000067 [Vibrio vulnificus]|uniref:hypothetical protein n=1 Tax=Vibrio vulnificus TaxID=672 RepID=UPI0018DC6D0D|nr:hypothetical protein [Vibrio vulnificus]ELH3004319.1 hypothetical protein [Vibrio vulnificus]ELK8326090.1 hypothetical protein [Vibrio vulnificus]ELN6894818.1 hypothetical protein [Vibrio vulnificus]ELU0079369.1 hypothetical protein [Vibrio vulnificus]ELV8585384.1 hypothetical protein [Vibrio vulnificus]